MKRFLEEGTTVGGKESVLLSVEEEQIGEDRRQRRRARKNCLVRCLPLHGQSRGQAKIERR